MEGNRNIMQLEDKNQKVDLFLKKLNIISENAINKNKYERAMAAISVSANLQYQYNQSYTDEKIENMILLISRNMERKYQERIDKIEIRAAVKPPLFLCFKNRISLISGSDSPGFIVPAGSKRSRPVR